jgi:hypothetical protein
MAVKLVGGHLKVDLEHVSYTSFGSSRLFDATIDLQVRARRRANGSMHLLTYS